MHVVRKRKAKGTATRQYRKSTVATISRLQRGREPTGHNVMEGLLYFVIWAVIIVLMMRLGCGAHIMGRGHGHGQSQNEPGKTGNPQLRWMPPTRDVDPVCHKTVATDMAKPSVYSGNVFYFCSRECREVFEAAPDMYIGGGDANHKGSEHSHA